MFQSRDRQGGDVRSGLGGAGFSLPLDLLHFVDLRSLGPARPSRRALDLSAHLSLAHFYITMLYAVVLRFARGTTRRIG